MVGWNSIYRDNDRQYPAARVMRAGINLIDDLKKKRPFYLGVDSFDPHEPFDAPQVVPARGRAARRASRRRRGSRRSSRSRRPTRGWSTWTSTTRRIERVRELYAAEITYVDEWIGRLMNKLADEKLLDETVVYYMSDHGLTLGENGVMGKDGARAQWHIYHVPAMIRHPEGKLAGADERLLRLDPRRVAHAALVHGRAGARG